MSFRPAIAERARVLLLVMLILGQLLLPAFAAACAAGDAMPGLDAVAAHAIDADGGNECCDNTACSDCCLHAGSAPVSAIRLVPVRFASVEPLPQAPSFAPGDYPVDIRPPIAM